MIDNSTWTTSNRFKLSKWTQVYGTHFFSLWNKPQKELFNPNGCDCVLTGITMKFFSKKAKGDETKRK